MIINDFLKQVPIVKDMTSAYNAYNIAKTGINKMASLPPVQESPINRTTVNSTAQAFLPPNTQGYTPTPTVGISTPAQDYNTSASKWAGSSTGVYKPPVSTGTPTPSSAGDAMITVYKNGQPREVRQSQLAGFLGSGFTTTAPAQPTQPTSIPGTVPGQPVNPTNPIQPTSTTPQTTPEQPTAPVNPTNDVYNKYGLKAPVAPTLNPQQDIMGQYKLTPEQIQANLDATKASIQQKYNLQRQEAERISENEKQSSLSSLYSTGEVNPLSSGASNVAGASDRNKASRLDSINQMQVQEERDAEMKAYDENYQAAGMKNDLYAQENKRIEDQYQLNRTQLDDTISLIDFGRKVTKEDTDNAKNSFADLLAQGGSQAFEGYGTEQLSSLDKASGQPQGTYANILKKIKMDELKGQSEIERLDDGSVVSWKQDEKGNWTHETLIKAPIITDTVVGTTKEDIAVAKGVSEAVQTAKNNVELIDEILNSDASALENVFGFGQSITSLTPGKTQLVKNQVEQIKQILSLDNRQKLKGTGTISDYEAKMLASAASSLGTNLQVEDAKLVMEQIKEAFQRGALKSMGYTQEEIEDAIIQSGTDINTLYGALNTSQPTFNLESQTSNKGVVTANIMTKFPEGSTGGQCGDFAHKLVNFPSVGDGKNDKIKSIEKFGIPGPIWKQNPQPGDVIITNENPTYGHVAVVLDIKPNGDLVLAESNYKRSDTVSYGRTINVSSDKIYGAIRGNLKA